MVACIDPFWWPTSFLSSYTFQAIGVITGIAIILLMLFAWFFAPPAIAANFALLFTGLADATNTI
jgi:hypothetical protein